MRSWRKEVKCVSVGFVVVLIGVFLVLTMLSTDAFGQKRKLSVFWHPGHHYKSYDLVIDRFMKEHPDVEVTVQFFRWPEMMTKLLTLFEVGNPPDILENYPPWTLEFGVKGYLEPLNERIEKWGEINDWLDVSMTHVAHEGIIYGIPLHLTNMSLFYNQDLFVEAGIEAPPKDWEEFVAVAKKLTIDRDGDGKPEVWGFPVSTNSMWSYPWFLQAGSELYDPETKKVTLDSPEGIEALQFLVDLIYKHKVSPRPVPAGGWSGEAEVTLRMFISGRSSMYVSGPWDVKPVQEGKPEFNWTIAICPKGRIKATAQHGVDIIIPKDAKNKDDAWELAKVLLSLDTEVEVTKEANMPMPRKSWIRHPVVQKMELLRPFIEQLPYSIKFEEKVSALGLPEIYKTLFQTAFEKALYRETSPKEALAAFAKEGNEVIRKKVK